MHDDLGWYDSTWLSKFLRAQQIIAEVAPSRLAGFVDSFRALRTDPGFVVKDIPNLFDADMLAEIKRTIAAIPPGELEMHEAKSFGRIIVHNNATFTALQATLTGRVSEWAGEEVGPRYNFLSLYTRMGICQPHLDAPSAKWTLDVCIDQSEPWPIYFSQIVPWPEQRKVLGANWQAEIKSSPDLKFQSKTLMPGNAILFSGSSQWHYRDALPAGSRKSFCDLLFFHYIPKGTSELIRSANWPKQFGIPELARIPDLMIDN
jgi:hypothetical protein